MFTKEENAKNLEDYEHAVETTARQILPELKGCKDEYGYINEHCDTHPYILDGTLQIHTLMYSENACAGIFHGTSLGDSSDYKKGTSFPFQSFAYDAFIQDVTDKINEIRESRKRKKTARS